MPEKNPIENPKEGQPSVDTVEAVLVDNDRVITDETPLGELKLPKSEFKDSYHVSCLIPFQSSSLLRKNVEDWSIGDKRFIHFYAGVQMALLDLHNRGVRLKVDVFDTKKSETEIINLSQGGQLNAADVIIGPYNRDAIRYLSEWCKNHEKTLVSPWISSTSIASDNPYYLQAKPGLLDHYETMIYHVLQHHPMDSVYLVLKEGDEQKMRYMNYCLENLDGDPEHPPYKILELVPDSLTYGQTAFDTTLFSRQSSCEKVFLVPYSSSMDGAFVYDFLRNLQVQQGKCKTWVYGMYKWLDYQDEMFDLLNAMDVYLTVSNLVNPEDPRIRSFKKRFLLEYGELPMDDAFEGYDIMNYVGSMLHKYGDKFQFSLNEETAFTGYQTVFHFFPIRDEKSGKIQYYDNKFLDLIEVKDFTYQRAGR